jgi:hypothetical protein
MEVSGQIHATVALPPGKEPPVPIVWRLGGSQMLSGRGGKERLFKLLEWGILFSLQCFFSSPPRPERLWGPPSLLSNGYQVLFSLGVKRPGREAGHSSPSSAEFKECVDLYLHSPNTSSWRGAQ